MDNQDLHKDPNSDLSSVTKPDLDSQSSGYRNVKKSAFGWRIVFWISMAVFVCALIGLGVICAGYIEGCKMYDEISEEVFDRGDNKLADMKVDWDALRKINSEVCGWIYVPGTKINYPIVHTADNEKYLKTTFHNYRSNISFGTIFLDYNNKPDFSDTLNFTYGHNMIDGSMYAFFDKYQNPDVLNNNRFIYLLTPSGNYKLSAFTCVLAPGNEKIVQANFSTNASKVDYINDKLNRGVSKLSSPIPDPAAMTKLFAFSTCDYSFDDARCIIYAYVYESTVDGVPGLT